MYLKHKTNIAEHIYTHVHKILFCGEEIRCKRGVDSFRIWLLNLLAPELFF